mmetsp:Transcript_17946/g.67689  ORF Transcript_17946/g.67689 Transcript_17946/m.67689 type:complete len:221 (+) Transcript_17946:403-1065(+)
MGRAHRGGRAFVQLAAGFARRFGPPGAPSALHGARRHRHGPVAARRAKQQDGAHDRDGKACCGHHPSTQSHPVVDAHVLPTGAAAAAAARLAPAGTGGAGAAGLPRVRCHGHARKRAHRRAVPGGRGRGVQGVVQARAEQRAWPAGNHAHVPDLGARVHPKVRTRRVPLRARGEAGGKRRGRAAAPVALAAKDLSPRVAARLVHLARLQASAKVSLRCFR